MRNGIGPLHVHASHAYITLNVDRKFITHIADFVGKTDVIPQFKSHGRIKILSKSPIRLD